MAGRVRERVREWLVRGEVAGLRERAAGKKEKAFKGASWMRIQAVLVPKREVNCLACLMNKIV